MMIPGIAEAACTSPVGKRGQFQVYGGKLKLCDGTNWHNETASSVQGTCGTEGLISRVGNELFYCTGGTNWRVDGTAGAACNAAEAGMIRFDDTAGVLRFCGGTSWMVVANGAASDPCTVPNAPIGTLCADNTIYAGRFKHSSETDWYDYFITPAGCTDSTTCPGGTDGTPQKMVWSSPAISPVGIETVSSISTKSLRSGSEYDSIAAGDSGLTALRYCYQMAFGGHTDWFLPSKSELTYLYCKAAGGSHNASNPQSEVNCVGVGGRESILPGFITASSSYNYWSSTQATASNAWALSFNNGSETSAGKTSTANFHVRCTRRTLAPP
ncbi:MAG: DUF1566 domain-containing protein [Bdellovibrionaceae bacterium]|nr:DUF1566 domain-containing protein [Pseudobdellovibrionaceae bacterium]